MGHFLRNAVLKLILLPITLYQYIISPLLGPNCRFTPSCSHYTAEALKTHGIFFGGWLSLKRLARCHPLGGQGVDPVPPAKVTLFDVPNSAALPFSVSSDDSRV